MTTAKPSQGRFKHSNRLVTMLALLILTLFAVQSSAAAAELSDDIWLFIPYSLDLFEDEGRACLVVQLSEPATQTVSVRFATTEPADEYPAIPHVDYTPIGGTLVFAPGESRREICFPIYDDEIDEFVGRINVEFDDVVNAVMGETRTVVFIKDNDGPAWLAVSQKVPAFTATPGERIDYAFRVTKEGDYYAGATARVDVDFEPPLAVTWVELIEPPPDSYPPARILCGPLVGGRVSCELMGLEKDEVSQFSLAVVTAGSFSGALLSSASVSGIRGTTNENPDSNAEPTPVLVSANPSAIYTPVTLNGFSGDPKGLDVSNGGPGGVTLVVPGVGAKAFAPGPGEKWWFVIGGGPQMVWAYSSSGPCSDYVWLGANSYEIEITFIPGQLRRINFICLDASRPPDGSGWTLYYYLEPVDESLGEMRREP